MSEKTEIVDGPVQPIRPGEVVEAKRKQFPKEVIESFNELIAKKILNGTARIIQDDVVRLMVEKGLKKKDIYENNLLDVEDIYVQAGWTVEYDKSGYNESYPSSFTFSAPKKS